MQAGKNPTFIGAVLQIHTKKKQLCTVANLFWGSNLFRRVPEEEFEPSLIQYNVVGQLKQLFLIRNLITRTLNGSRQERNTVWAFSTGAHVPLERASARSVPLIAINY
jgi:hypothetical protein